MGMGIKGVFIFVTHLSINNLDETFLMLRIREKNCLLLLRTVFFHFDFLKCLWYGI